MKLVFWTNRLRKKHHVLYSQLCPTRCRAWRLWR